jgi:hypothetical protein
VPGITRNSVDFVPLGTTSSGKFQINVDGQQVTQNTAAAGFGQPQYSRDAMSQFQIITNRFDATLGRSSQVQVNAQTKSGSNQLHGSAYGYFRNDSMNASDFIAKRVLPFSDQQYGGTIGGPILHDKLFFFGAFEGERQPSTIFTTPTGFGGLTFSFPTQLKTTSYLGRFDYQASANHRFSARVSAFTWDNPFTDVAGTEHPSRASARTRTAYSILGTWAMVHGAGLVNEVKVGFNHFDWNNQALVASQEYRFGSVTIGGRYNYPQNFIQGTQQYRDDLFWLKGKHSVKAGVEYLFDHHTGIFQQNLRGTVASFSKDPADFAAIFPKYDDPSTWNLAALAPLANSFVQGFGNFNMDIPRNTIGTWMQDDWKVSPKLVLNLGLRYDNDLGVFDPGLRLASGIVTPRSGDNRNIAPRIGFAYDILGNRKTVIRGGAGIYYADVQANQVIDQQIFNGERSLQVSVDKTPTASIDLSSPFGKTTGSDFINHTVAAPVQAIQIMDHNAHTPYSFQSSIGFEHEIVKDWTLQADYVHWRVYHDWIRTDDNLVYDPTTGFNKNPTKLGRPDPRFTTILSFHTPNAAGAINDALQMELRKRMSFGLTLGASYTLARLKDSTSGPFYYANNPFDFSGDWGRSADDQKHTISINGSYQMKWGFQTSAFYHFGSGSAYQVVAGGNPFGGSVTNRTFLATTKTYNDPKYNHASSTAAGYMVTDRNQLYGAAIHRLDARVSKSVTIHERYRMVGILEAFNLFNHANYGSYQTTITAASYGAPAQNLNLAYSARMLQLAARFEF